MKYNPVENADEEVEEAAEAGEEENGYSIADGFIHWHHEEVLVGRWRRMSATTQQQKTGTNKRMARGGSLSENGQKYEPWREASE